MTHGFSTTQTLTGFNWTISRTEWDAEIGKGVTTIVKNGTASTRAKALGAAKKWVVFFRRGGSL